MIRVNLKNAFTRLRLGELLGEGAFGKVVKGFAEGLCGKLEEPITVAVKMPKGFRFFQEARLIFFV